MPNLYLLHATLLLASGEAAPLIEGGGGEDIVVTAQRRQERITETPLAVSALTQDFVDRTELNDITDVIAYTPGFSGDMGGNFIDALAIRGIVSNDYGIGGDPSIGVFKDGVHQGRTGAAVTSLFDVERVEALRGPQGFLFGRNAISGAISVITNKPDASGFGGHLYVGAGERNLREGEVAVNVPLGSGWAARAAGYHIAQDGWVDNASTPDRNDGLLGAIKSAGRLSLSYEDGPIRAVLIGEFERRRLNGTLYRASNEDREVLDPIDVALGAAVTVRGGPFDVDSDLADPRDDGEIGGITGQVDRELGFATLTGLGAYREHRFRYLEDYDGTPLLLNNYSQRQRGSYASAELRLVSPSTGRISWSAGLSGYRERVRARFTNDVDEQIACTAGYGYASCQELTTDLFGTDYVPAPGGVLVDANAARSINTGWSAYGDANLRVTPRLTMGAGLRYTWDRKRFALDIPPAASTLGNIWAFTYFTDGPIEDQRAWDGLTPRLYARYEIFDGINAYAALTRGFKAGGFGSFTVAAPIPIEDFGLVPEGTRPDAFAPETVWSREVGVKGTVLDGRLQFDLTGFHYRYRNLQSVFFDTDTRTQQVVNVGNVIGYGIEAAAQARPARWLEFGGTVTWTRTRKSGDRDCSLKDCGGLPNPTWASSGVATVSQPLRAGEAYLQGEWTYQGRRREAFDWRGITRRDAYSEANLRLGYRSDEGWEAVAYVQNVLDSRYWQGAENGGDLTPASRWSPNQPRNVGVDLRWRFGAER